MPNESTIRPEVTGTAFADVFEPSLRRSAEVALASIDACRASTERAVELIVDVYRGGGRLFFCGNGGSAADAQHLATELMIRLDRDIERPALGAISLATDPSNMTAGGNDIGFEKVFARNLQGLGRAGDGLVAISTSGNSPNILEACRLAARSGIATIGLTGGTGGRLAEEADVAIVVPSDDVQHIQETHITLGHIICVAVERTLYPKS